MALPSYQAALLNTSTRLIEHARNRPKDPGPPPRVRMGAAKRVFLLAFGIVFDGLKFGAVSLVFLAPLAAGTLVGVAAANHASTVGCWAAAIAATPLAMLVGPEIMQEACNTGGTYGATHPQTVGAVAGAVTTVAAGTAEATAAPITAAVMAVGVFFAIIIGFLGWIFCIGFLLITRSISLSDADEGAQILIALMIGFGVSEMPLVDAIPTFTPSLWRITSIVHHADKKKHAAWKKKNDEFQKAKSEQLQQKIVAARAVVARNQAIPAADLQPAY